MTYVAFCKRCEQVKSIDEFPRFRDANSLCTACQRDVSRRHGGGGQRVGHGASVKSQNVVKSPTGPCRDKNE